MTGLPGYYLVETDSTGEPDLDSSGEPTISGTLVTLPVADRYGATIGFEENDLVQETEKGRRWVFKQFRRRVRKMIFRCTETELAAFRTLHDAVDGQDQPFIFVPDVSNLNPATFIFCRKDKDFLPKEFDSPGMEGGVLVTVFDYALEISEEPTGLEIAL